MRITSTVLLSLFAICVTGMVLAQEFPHDSDFSPMRLPQAPRNYDPTMIPSGDGRRLNVTLLGSRDTEESRLQLGNIQMRIEEATGKLTSEVAEERESATSVLESAVTDLFELRAEERLKQIEELEQRLAKLREQMERREEKKSEIIQLQVQTYINQANGLGF